MMCLKAENHGQSFSTRKFFWESGISKYMNKFVFSFALVFSCFLFGAPVGNPAFPRLLQDGFLIPNDQCFNIRLGYEGDFVFDARLKQTNGRDRRIDDYKQDTNSGSVTLNLFERLDLFGIFGATRTCADWRFINDEMVHRVQLETRYHFLWAVGGRVCFLEWGCTYFGFGGRYSAADQKPIWATMDGTLIPTHSTRLNWKVWQLDFDISHQMEIFIPYIGVKYSNVHSNLGEFSFPIANEDSGILHMKNRTPVGIVIGCTLTTERYFMLNIEARLIDEMAGTVTADFRF